jgi:hypothetical protein
MDGHHPHERGSSSMKKILFILCFFIVNGLLFAGSPLHMGAGIKTGYLLAMPGSEYEIMGTETKEFQLLHDIIAGGYLDIDYVRIDIDFAIMLGGNQYTDGEPADFPSDNFISYIYATILLKYPINLGGVKLWPGVGARYSFCIGYTMGGTNFLDSDDADLNDIYMSGGLGLDIPAGPLCITPSILFHYNITPNPLKEIMIPGMLINWFEIEAGIGLAFLF